MLRPARRQTLEGGGQGLVRVPAQQVPRLSAPCHQARDQRGRLVTLCVCIPVLPRAFPVTPRVSVCLIFREAGGTAHTWASRDPLLGSWGPWGVNHVRRALSSICMLAIPALTPLCFLRAPRCQAARGRWNTMSGSPTWPRSGTGSQRVTSPARAALLGGELG